MKRGLFITFEGPDGSGKTTQIKKLEQFLQESGRKTILTREPGGTAIGEKIRTVILDPSTPEMNPIAEALLYAASRAQHTAELILPALAEGTTVICDRYMDSSIAYQGFGRKLGEPVRLINEFAVMGLVPDLTFLLLIDPERGRSRISGELDRLELEKASYHQDVYEGYGKLAEAHPQRIVRIDGDREIEEIHAEILETLKKRFAFDEEGLR